MTRIFSLVFALVLNACAIEGGQNGDTGSEEVAERTAGATSSNVDSDGDGYVDGADCDPGWDGTYPGATEWYDGEDNDCDGLVDENCDESQNPNTECVESAADPETTEAVDVDGDGYSEEGGDCDDSSSAIHPGATETCDAVDSDCDGDTDEGCDSGTDEDTDTDPDTDEDCDDIDNDGDGYSECDGDCNDGWRYTYPGAVEYYDGEDQDCDGTVDEGCSGVSWNGSCE